MHNIELTTPHGSLFQMHRPSIPAMSGKICKILIICRVRRRSHSSPLSLIQLSQPNIDSDLTSLIPLFQPIMVTTREANANAHPGAVVRRAQRSRRTREEIEKEKADAKAKSIAAKQEAAAKHRAVISTIAALKSSVEREEEAIRANSNRPDLQYSSPNGTRRALTQALPPRVQKTTAMPHDSAM